MTRREFKLVDHILGHRNAVPIIDLTPQEQAAVLLGAISVFLQASWLDAPTPFDLVQHSFDEYHEPWHERMKPREDHLSSRVVEYGGGLNGRTGWMKLERLWTEASFDITLMLSLSGEVILWEILYQPDGQGGRIAKSSRIFCLVADELAALLDDDSRLLFRLTNLLATTMQKQIHNLNAQVRRVTDLTADLRQIAQRIY